MPAQDIFDVVAQPAKSGGDIFDRAASESKSDNYQTYDLQASPTLRPGQTELPPPPDPFEGQTVLRQGRPVPLLQRFRESLAPFLGPTQRQVSQDSIPVKQDDGSIRFVYRPAGGIEQKGLLPTLSQPVVEIPKFKPDPKDASVAAAAKAAWNVAAGFGEFLESPLGVSTGGIAGEAKSASDALKIGLDLTQQQKAAQIASRAIAGGFAAQMASQVPETLRHVTDTNGTTQEHVEALLGLASEFGIGTALSMHAAYPRASIKAGRNIAEQKGIAAPKPDTLAPQTTEALKQTEKGEPNASEISKTAEVHGDVQSQQQPAVELPKPVSSEGVQPQAQVGLQEVPAQPYQGAPETPLNPGGAESTLTPEQQAISRQNNSRAAFEALAKATGTKLPEPIVEQSVNNPETVQKYKVGNSPQTWSLIEKLPQDPFEKANNEQPVKVKNDKTGEVETMLESDLTPVKTRTAEEKVPKRDLDAELRAAKLDPSVFQNAAQKREALKRQAAIISEGPGAASPGDVPGGSELKQLTGTINAALDSDSPLPEKISMIERAKDKIETVKQDVDATIAKAKAIKQSVWDEYAKPAEWSDEKEAVGKWTYANQKADFEARQFAKAVTKAVPDKLRREAITNWIQADGDEALLRERMDASKPPLKNGYKMALQLTDYEKSLAGNIKQYLESQLQRGQEQGVLKEGVENYINQVWNRDNPVSKAIRSDFQAGKLQPNFQFAKKRIFDSYFEGEQAGFRPKNKDVGALIAFYDQAFNKSLAARGFLKDLHEGKASDGRPLVEVAGSAPIIEKTGERSLEQPKTILIKPHATPENMGDYRAIDHPAMRGWKWVQTLPDGTTLLMQGDLKVHPEAYSKLRNRLMASGWRTFEIGGIRPGQAILGAQTALKQTMLSVSGFHQVQEALHALGHRVNPMNLDKVDFDNPVQKDLISHGLQVSDYHAMEAFSEGLSSGSLINKIPVIGKRILGPYTEYLFQDYIPRLKVTMAQHALERNMERYGGKLSRDQILEMTANQANAAFGELNYKYMGRHPGFQDTMRALLLAPDFLEARARFVGQAAKPYGREQLVALGLLAATSYITARLFNKTMDDDWHWDKPFSYVYKGREYTLRTVPGDILHLFSDPRSFSYNRLSPLISRPAIEAITGRDDRGVKRDALEQIKDLAKTAIPLSFKVRDDVKLWESFLNAFGVRERKYTAVNEISDLARKWKQSNTKPSAFQETYDAEADQYRPLRVALDSEDLNAAQKAYDKLKQDGVAAAKINDNLHRYYTRGFAGSKANESKFIATLNDDQKQKYQEAKDEQKRHLELFSKVKK